MNPGSEKWVPKVHPATRAVEAEDPFELHATAVTGDPEVMLQCLVQEYAWMGWDAARIIGLFRDPSYPALNALREAFGEEGVSRRVHELLATMGVYRFEGTVHDEPEPDDAEPERIELGIRWPSSVPDASPCLRTHDPLSEGGNHAGGL
jgi:hypothetical protein